MFVYNIFISKATCFNFGFNPLKVTTDVPSDIDPETPPLNNQARFVTLISWYLETFITITTPQKILSWLIWILISSSCNILSSYIKLMKKEFLNSPSQNKHFQVRLSYFWNPTHIIKLVSFHQLLYQPCSNHLMSQPWKIFTSAGINPV